MNTVESMKMSTNPRLLKDVLTLYKSTFYALKELIDNSIQANAKRIEIDLIPSSCGEDSIHYHRIETIEVKDNGEGVPFSRFKNSIMQIATEDKAEGQGTYNFENGQVTNRVSGYTDFWQGFSKLPGMQQLLEYMSGEEDFGKFVSVSQLLFDKP